MKGERRDHGQHLHRGSQCFNPRSPREGRATTAAGCTCNAGQVSIRALPVKGERHSISNGLHLRCDVSIRALPVKGERRFHKPSGSRCDTCFNPRSPREGRATNAPAGIWRRRRSFNPRSPREGRATTRLHSAGVRNAVSIRALPVKGERRGSRACGPCHERVSIRALPVKGERRRSTCVECALDGVSIRALPVKGERQVVVSIPATPSLFQSALSP